MKNIRIGVICNNRMAIPAIRQLFFLKVLAGVAVPDTNTDLKEECHHILAGTGVPLTLLSKKDLSGRLTQWKQEAGADYVLMMTFPWKIPVSTLDRCPGQFFNFHYGLLPEMRGVDPVFESIRSGAGETGITIHLVTAQLDKGPVLHRQLIPLGNDITHGMLCSQLAALGAQLCQALLPLLSREESPALLPQPDAGAKYYGRPGLREVAIDWENMTSAEVHALVRACNPWNKGAYTAVRGWNFRICNVSFSGETAMRETAPGTIITADHEQGVRVCCKDGKNLQLHTIYTDEGIFEGARLADFGIVAGDVLQRIF